MFVESEAIETETMRAEERVVFPSIEWFERLAKEMRRQREIHVHLGDVDCVAQVTVTNGGARGEPWHARITFEGFEASEVRPATAAEAGDADFVIEADLATWRAMIASIARGNGRPELSQTLNFLSLPGTPIRVWSDDPVRRDAFFRFIQSIQEFFNGSAAFTTVFSERPA